MSAVRLGVDAFNLEADRRGMGRLVRQTLEDLQRLQTQVLLIKRAPAQDAIMPRDLPRLHLDAVWYPWNAMRFAPHAPSIVTINDPFAFTYPHRSAVARWREQAPIRRAIRRADCIFTISNWGAGELRRLFHVRPERLRVVHPAVDAFWHPVAGVERAPYVLFVGGPDARKNAGLLFEAYDAAFGDGGPRLVVAGTLNAADERRLTAMRAPRERVTPNDDELRALYSGALAVAVPSLAEGFGLPVVEAMACGAPVLASDASALPEAAGGAALLLPPQDVNAWSEALRRIAGDAQLRTQLRERGFERVRRMPSSATASALLESARRLRGASR
ncbi:MAG TPA: glycosyltransferase family 1 protein [Candidatus Baltobacteraceae bacterium]|nr:glycosyltransferase family 1 protein [Candidatus Baltobacteraceae bacterium]